MNRKRIKRADASELKTKSKKINVKKVLYLIKKIGNPFDETSSEYGKYTAA
ncbi:MAG: hypothetical protein UX99_C0002G0006 [Candidatus Amesbacteria bacterium GW2011_GWB1_47_26]|uniref:Uncharacterized protein n=1 Tax=Candidatus Amesbacteria bacterium GW2011_GWC2_45_19 TaxID=1618366 RepID=A0A0G1Q1J9_9BACT|nr:MAG: hypothetical protein UX05_C0011G0006 [Candidatus Amesbacteria bacterium GW2011_GWC2_45_19]KKU37869.1 MAG: hypothetical protein UX52_C0016G0020 [Candidatus Amesbacteria bacterium GW2011_GWA1_46_35]KKU69331.1 MAG: hypothetical protein UX93_C0002G0170 [Microgenomates group bacterium GW2011_GWC1_47_20]KKU75035.1 MAG: hypothetical protein UX99_C0002G0006 [Candidatus Amesbacteria bacterium GW2011_GWB1_47_26]